jgi:putative two-component system response regulator
MPATEGHEGIILVVDDNEANRELLSALLSAEGYEVVCAANGEEALARVHSGSIDLALLDVVMPRPTGFEVCQAMKCKPETRLIPVILLTSLNSDADRIHGIMCGADDFLNKPVNKQELLARVYSLLRLKQFTDELDNAEMVLFSLALTIEAKDPYTEGHCDRLSKYSVELGEKTGFAPGPARRSAPRRSYTRYRQAGRAGEHPAQTRTTDSRGTKNHGAAYDRRGANLRAAAILPQCAADHSSPP